MFDVLTMESLRWDGYRTAISLNNSVITMLEKGSYRQGRETLLDSITAMKKAFETSLQGPIGSGCEHVVSPHQEAHHLRSLYDLMLRRMSHRLQFPEKWSTGMVWVTLYRSARSSMRSA